jgi:hypothetical protein
LVASAFLSSFFLANFISVLAGAEAVAAGAVVVLVGSAAKALATTKVAIRVTIDFILSFL